MDKLIYQEKLLFPEILWERPVHYYKSQAGKVLVLAGSSGMTGAAILTCEAVFRSGTGVLLLGFPEKTKEFYKEVLPEAMTLPLPSTYSGSLAKKAEGLILGESKASDVIIIGPGLSTNSETVHLIWELVFKLEKPVVLDADGLSALAQGIAVMRSKESEDFMSDFFAKRRDPLIITPHPGEAFRILDAAKLTALKDVKLTPDYVEKHKEKISRILSDALNCFVILKGHNTNIVEPSGRQVVNLIGGPELAKAGTGDVLSGIVGSFVAQNPDEVFEAAATAVYLHGLAGEIAKEALSDRSVMASDVIKYLPQAIKKAENL
jgi:NAD(P)H-hydrate epimerase